MVLNHTTRPTYAYKLKEIVEYYKSHSTSVYACFMDASKAFDRVNHWTLFKKMIASGMLPIFVRLIVTWYCEQRACVPEINYSIILYSMYRQNICQATYVLYSCDMCVISYMCGTMAYSIDVSARWSN